MLELAGVDRKFQTYEPVLSKVNFFL